MSSIKQIFILVCAFCVMAFSANNSLSFNISEKNVCEDDIVNICGMPFPETYQAVFDARFCLRSSLVEVSDDCLDYVNNISPSLIEPCFNEITTYCKNVSPGANRIQACLAKYETKLSEECSFSLDFFYPPVIKV